MTRLKTKQKAKTPTQIVLHKLELRYKSLARKRKAILETAHAEAKVLLSKINEIQLQIRALKK